MHTSGLFQVFSIGSEKNSPTLGHFGTKVILRKAFADFVQIGSVCSRGVIKATSSFCLHGIIASLR